MEAIVGNWPWIVAILCSVLLLTRKAEWARSLGFLPLLGVGIGLLFTLYGNEPEQAIETLTVMAATFCVGIGAIGVTGA